MIAEYEIKNVRILEDFLNKEIGTEYDSNQCKPFLDGYITVFDITIKEHKKIKDFIKKSNLRL